MMSTIYRQNDLFIMFIPHVLVLLLLVVMLAYQLVHKSKNSSFYVIRQEMTVYRFVVHYIYVAVNVKYFA